MCVVFFGIVGEVCLVDKYCFKLFMLFWIDFKLIKLINFLELLKIRFFFREILL